MSALAQGLLLPLISKQRKNEAQRQGTKERARELWRTGGKVKGHKGMRGLKVSNPCVTGLKSVSLNVSGGISWKLQSRKVKRQKYTGIFIFKRQLFAREMSSLRILGN